MKTTIFRFLFPFILLVAAMVAYATDFSGTTKPVMEDPAITLQQKAVRSQYDLQQALSGFGTNSLRTTATMGNTNVGATVLNTVPVTGTFWQATQPVSGTVTANLGSTNVGATVLNTVPVTGTFYQATQPVSLATAPTTPVTGTFWQATQPVSGSVTATLANTNVGATILNTVPVTGAFWQATQPVSGTVTATGPVTDTQLRATAVPVSLATAPTTPVTGTFWQATQPVSGTVTANLGNTNVGATVLNTPTVNLNSDTNQVKLAGTLPAFAATPTVNAAQSGAWTVTGAGGTFPVTGTFWQATQPVSGTVTANLGSTNVGATVLNTVPVTGTFWPGTQPVSGTFWQATQPVSGTVTATLGNTNVGATVLNTVPVAGTFWQATQPVSGTFWQTTQPVSGSVTATLGNTNVGSTVLNVPAVILTPSPFLVNIVAAANSYQVTNANLVRMLNVYNTNAGSIYVMFGTNAGFAFEVATNSNTQWSAPAGMALYSTNIWLRGATGVVNGVTFQ